MANGLEMMLSTEVELLQAENARLREQLAAAQAKQEPVAWMVVTADDKLVFINANQAEHYAKQWELEACPLFAAPVVQPQQEPVGKPHRWNDDGERCLDCGDKDWMADKYCSAAPVVQEKQEPWPFSADRVTYHKAAPVVQPGMVLVPREPTEAMLDAAMNRYKHVSPEAKARYTQMHRENFRCDYKAMIAAAEWKSNAEVNGGRLADRPSEAV